MQAVVEEAVVRAPVVELDILRGDSREDRVLAREQGVRALAAVRRPAAPVRPLVLPRAPAVVPAAVGEHELGVSAHGLDDFPEELAVFQDQSVQDEAGKITDSVMVVEALPTVYTENRVPGKPAIRENRPLTDTEINYRYREYTKGKSTRSISMEEQLNDTSWAYENE